MARQVHGVAVALGVGRAIAAHRRPVPSHRRPVPSWSRGPASVPGVVSAALALGGLVLSPQAHAQETESGMTDEGLRASGALELATPPAGSSASRSADAATPEPAAEADAATPEPAAEEPLRWRNSIALLSTSINTTAFGNADLTHNPTLVTSMSLRPRWYVSNSAFVGLRQDVTLELTDTDCVALYSTCRTRNREPFLSDAGITFFENNLFSVDAFTFAAGATVTLPASIASRNRGMIASMGPIARVTYVAPNVLSGLILQVIGSYRYTFGDSSLSNASAPYANTLGAESRADVVAAGAQGEAFVIGGPSPQSHAGNATILSVLNPIPDFNVIASFSWLWRQPNEGGGPFFIDGVLTSPDGFEVSDRENQFRLFTVFGLSVSYNFASWLNVALNYTHFTTEFAPEGGRRNPFWSEDSTVGLSATMTVDQLYRTLREGESEGNPLQNMVAEGRQQGAPLPSQAQAQPQAQPQAQARARAARAF